MTLCSKQVFTGESERRERGRGREGEEGGRGEGEEREREGVSGRVDIRKGSIHNRCQWSTNREQDQETGHTTTILPVSKSTQSTRWNPSLRTPLK